MNNPLRVLVTGGSRGIGRAIAERFQANGHLVCIVARQTHTLESAIRSQKPGLPPIVGVQADLAVASGVAPAIQSAIHQLGGSLDILVNNAGIFDMAPLEATSLDMWQRFLEINLTAPFLVTQAAIGQLRKSEHGHIFNVSSVAGQQGFPKNTAYCTTKYGLRGFSDALREELRPDSIRVTSIYPGATDTDIFNTIDGEWDRSSMNLPEDVAESLWKAHLGPGDQADVTVPPRK